eukprot:TRINITY_DN16822_c0_g2_i2.p1 TRINITY_DN16822_c0_g2~~TRINITY_DN16822_c0_g2_i2.p1  ORF type:complete len:370 (+),score=105.77 TRINITY_DN16822_c0_g2_i2:23-1132(+)
MMSSSCYIAHIASLLIIYSYVVFFFFFFLMIRRPPRSPLSSSSAASDVYKRQVSTQSTGTVGAKMAPETSGRINWQMDDLFMVTDVDSIERSLVKRWNMVSFAGAVCAGVAVTMGATDPIGAAEYPFWDEVFGAAMGVSFVLSLASINSMMLPKDIQWFIRESQGYHLLSSYLLFAAIGTMVTGHVLLVLLLHGTEKTASSTWAVGAFTAAVLLFSAGFYTIFQAKIDTRLCKSISNVQELQAVFNTIDVLARGRVSTEEMKLALQDPDTRAFIGVTLDKVNEAVMLADADGDGWVTWAEFRDYLSVRRGKEVFHMLDADGDGTISPQEFEDFYGSPRAPKHAAVSRVSQCSDMSRMSQGSDDFSVMRS